MKRVLFFLGLSLFCVQVFAQQPSRPRVMNTEERLAMWKDSLKLSDAQLKQLWEIERMYNPEFDTVKREVVFDAIKAREQTRLMKIKEVLTEEQNARLSEMQLNERKARRRMSTQAAPPVGQ